MTSWRTWNCPRSRRLWIVCTPWSMARTAASSRREMWVPWSTSWKVGLGKILFIPFFSTLTDRNFRGKNGFGERGCLNMVAEKLRGLLLPGKFCPDLCACLGGERRWKLWTLRWNKPPLSRAPGLGGDGLLEKRGISQKERWCGSGCGTGRTRSQPPATCKCWSSRRGCAWAGGKWSWCTLGTRGVQQPCSSTCGFSQGIPEQGVFSFVKIF